MAKDRGEVSITDQILIYPITDLSIPNYQDYLDDRSPARTATDMNWFIRHYVSRDEDFQNPYASPMLREDLAGLPAALLITAEHDNPTRQCNAYAQRFTEAGVSANLAYYRVMVQRFFTPPDVFDAAHDAAKRIAKGLSSATSHTH